MDPNLDPMTKLRILSANKQVSPEENKAIATEIGHARDAQKNRNVILTAFDKAAEENTPLGRISLLGREPASIKTLNAMSLPLFTILRVKLMNTSKKLYKILCRRLPIIQKYLPLKSKVG